MPRVLVVDDAPALRSLLARCLHDGGYETLLAADGLEAIALMESGERVDIVVTDHAMPGATGLEVISAALRLHPGLPCIIVTAYHDLDLAMAAMAEGASGFLPKPFKPQHLLVVVEQALERRRVSDEATRLRLVAPLLERFTLLLANAIEAKDASTSLHCERLVMLADLTAESLGVVGDQRANVRLGACLHDVGKVGVPDELLQAPRGLEDHEWRRMRRHPEIGAAILDGVEDWRPVRAIVLHHHERFDGSGYPDGLAGAAIPIGARIVSVVDAYDVMRSGRPYQQPRSTDAAVAELQRQAGSQFDPDCVTAFLEVVDQQDPVAELMGAGVAVTESMSLLIGR